MITVNETATNLDDGIKNMMNNAKKDYERWSTSNDKKNCSMVIVKTKLIVGTIKSLSRMENDT